MHDLVKMIKDDLVMMEVQSTKFYKKGSNVVRIHHYGRLIIGKVAELS